MDNIDWTMFDKTEILLKCSLCGKEKIIEVNKDDLLDYYNGKLIQGCFPYLSIEERELMISQICGKCWDDNIKDED